MRKITASILSLVLISNPLFAQQPAVDISHLKGQMGSARFYYERAIKADVRSILKKEGLQHIGKMSSASLWRVIGAYSAEAIEYEAFNAAMAKQLPLAFKQGKITKAEMLVFDDIIKEMAVAKDQQYLTAQFLGAQMETNAHRLTKIAKPKDIHLASEFFNLKAEMNGFKIRMGIFPGYRGTLLTPEMLYEGRLLIQRAYKFMPETVLNLEEEFILSSMKAPAQASARNVFLKMQKSLVRFTSKNSMKVVPETITRAGMEQTAATKAFKRSGILVFLALAVVASASAQDNLLAAVGENPALLLNPNENKTIVDAVLTHLDTDKSPQTAAIKADFIETAIAHEEGFKYLSSLSQEELHDMSIAIKVEQQLERRINPLPPVPSKSQFNAK